MSKIFVGFVFGALTFAGSLFTSPGTPGGQDAGTLHNNSCVRCHSRISAPAELTGRYLDWHLSPHKKAGVACDKCHGGDPHAADEAKAHQGVLRPSLAGSRLNEANEATTCAECHRAIADSFVESKHYERLKSSGLGPTCTSCHHHMANTVARLPSQGESLCAFCHSSENGLLPPNPAIVRNAKNALDAMMRTDRMISWVSELLAEAEKKKINVASEKEDLRLLEQTLIEAKVGWHAFTLEGPLRKAEKSFDEAVHVRDRLAKKLGDR
jgi:hypothetical protein